MREKIRQKGLTVRETVSQVKMLWGVKLLECLQGEWAKVQDLQPRVEQAFINPDGTVWNHLQITQFAAEGLHGGTEYGFVSEYYYRAYNIYLYSQPGREFIGDAVAAAQNSRVRVAGMENESLIENSYRQLMSDYDSQNPLNETRSGVPTLIDIIEKYDPHSDSDREMLDMIFSQPETSEDLAFALVFKSLDKSNITRQVNEVGSRKILKGGVSQEKVNKILMLPILAKDYFQYWRNHLYDMYFGGIEDNHLEELPVLKYILAGTMLDDFSVIPEVYARMLQDGFYGTLSEDIREYLVSEYTQRFDKKYGRGSKREDIDIRLDDEGLSPYIIARQTLQSGKADDFLTSIPIQDFSYDAMKDFLSNFTVIQKDAAQVIHTISRENGLIIDIGSYTQGLLDILVLTEDQGIVIQIDGNGRLYGFNPELSDKVQSVIAMAVDKALTHFKEQGILREKAVKPERITFNGNGGRKESVISVRNESAEAEDIVRFKQPKRKTLRRLGLTSLPTSIEEGKATPPLDNKTQRYTITFSDVFRDELSSLPEDVRTSILQTVGRVGKNGDGLRKLIMSRQVGVPLFRARVKKNYRVVFVDGGDGKLVAIKVENRSDVYDSLGRKTSMFYQRIRDGAN